jgi:hypothetical protein
VTATLATLSADDVDTEIEAFLDVLRVADHVHVDDAVLVQLVDNRLWWHAHGRDEEFRTGVDDDVDELVELAFCVVVAGEKYVKVSVDSSGGLPSLAHFHDTGALTSSSSHCLQSAVTVDLHQTAHSYHPSAI